MARGFDPRSAVRAFGSRWLPVIDRALARSIAEETSVGGTLAEPASYWFRFPGRRVRPLALIAACELVGGRAEEAVDGACAIELIHTSSLILDDLPCMDDSAERRGVAALHRLYGESTALLVALLLFNLAHRRLASLCAARAAGCHERICDLLGGNGMIGGQDVDLRSAREDSVPAGLDVVHVRLQKTTSLMAAALELGGRIGGGERSGIEALGRFGVRVGRLLQGVDDLVDGPELEGLQLRNALTAIDTEREAAIAELGASFATHDEPRAVLEGIVHVLVEPARPRRAIVTNGGACEAS